MNKISKTIVFFGTDSFSVVALQELISSNYKISAVITKPDSKSGRGQKIKAPEVKELALKNGITVLQPVNISDINKDLISLGPNIIGIAVSFGKIIPKSTLDLFNLGIINVHPSLLPLYRGPSPIESAIKNGDKQTGVSIMRLTPEMDAGPIYGVVNYNLLGNETRPELYETLAKIGTTKLIELLPNIINGSIQPILQDNTKATYCKLMDKKEAWIKPAQVTAAEAERIVRAHLNFPKTKTNIIGNDIIITKAHVSIQQETSVDILCKDKKYLSIDELVTANGRKMSIKDFLNGHKNNLNIA